MSITASQVKALRDATGVGMMACKKALVECGGDLDEATTYLQKKGIADSAKRAGRSASEGIIAIAIADDGRTAALLELNCETDFVSRNDEFQALADNLVALALDHRVENVSVLRELDWNGAPVEQRIQEATGKIGEKLVARRLACVSISDGVQGGVGSYIHAGGQIGVVVAVQAAGADDVGSDAFGTLTRDLSMHVAASDPSVVSGDELDADEVAKKQSIFAAQAQESGKPAEIVEKIVVGRLNKWKKEVSLVNQPFVKNPDDSVEKQIAGVSKEHFSGPATVLAFVRFAVGGAAE
jgi:elongation factor Ts